MSTVSWLARDTPLSPRSWNTLATSFSIASLPFKSATITTSTRLTERDIYYDITRLSASSAQFKSVYADVIGIDSARTTLNVPVGGSISIYTRVISPLSPLDLIITPQGTRSSVVAIYATKLDQPINCQVGSGTPFSIDIDPAKGHCGVQITMSQGNVTVKYPTRWDALEISSPELMKTLNTQLRVASILFWLRPRIAQALASHVALVTYNSAIGANLNMSANALGQQLLITAMTGPSLHYAPTLTLDTYKRTLQAALDVAAAYEQQYDRFSDRKTSVGDQMAAFDVMISKARDIVTFQNALTDEAQLRWVSAGDTLTRSEASLLSSSRDLKEQELLFQGALEVWRTRKALETAFTMITAIMSFGAAIGEMCLGDPAGLATAPAKIEAAVSSVASTASTLSQSVATVNKAVMTTLKTSLAASLAVYESTNKVVQMTIAVQKDRTVTPPLLTKDESVLQTYGLDDIETLAAWDEWILQADAQMQWTESEAIQYAAAYRLELRKHAVQAKLVTQARTQAIKAGMEYSHLAVAAQMAQMDLERLQTLRSTFQSQSDTAEETRALFYDKLALIKTGVLIEMRKAAWAYNYLSLADSHVILDPTKSIADLRADSLTVTQEVERWQEMSSSDFSPFRPTPMLASEISSTLGTSMVKSLQTTGAATFTLAPTTYVGAGTLAFSGPFVDGSRFRIQGIRTYLIGAKSKVLGANGTSTINLAISTSGVYADVKAGSILNFVMTPLARPFKYVINPGSNGFDATSVVIDSFIPSRDYVEPTPFSQWTITIKQPELLDLSGLIDVKFEWTGSARFDI